MRCASPQCQIESNYLRDGGLYWIDDVIASSALPQRHFIWLCSQCAPLYSVQTWRPPGEQLVLKTPPRAAPPAHTPRLPRRLPARSLPAPALTIAEIKRRARA